MFLAWTGLEWCGLGVSGSREGLGKKVEQCERREKRIGQKYHRVEGWK